jgi:hypothetical protein
VASNLGAKAASPRKASSLHYACWRSISGREQFLQTVGAVDVARHQLGRQGVAVIIEQQEPMIAGGLKVSVVGAVLLWS